MGQYSPQPSLLRQGINSSRNFQLPDGSTVDPRGPAWKAQTGNSVLSSAGFRTFSQEPALEPSRCRTDTGKREQHMTASVAFVTKSLRARSGTLRAALPKHRASGAGFEPLDHRRLTRPRRVPRAGEREDSDRDDRGATAARRVRRSGGLRHCARTSGSALATLRFEAGLCSSWPSSPSRSALEDGRLDPRRFGRRPDPSVSGGRCSRRRGGRASAVPNPGSDRRALPSHVRWHRTAERLLGIPPRPLPLPGLHQRPRSVASGSRGLTARGDRGALGP